MRGIFAIDPSGGSTGVAWGIFDETADTVGDAMRNRVNDGSTTITGDEMEQIHELFSLWQSFKQACVRSALLDPEQVDLVIEDFILVPGTHSGGKEGISPVRVGFGFETYRLGRADRWHKSKHVTKAIFQPASAMRNERLLRKWNAWVRGREHERSAWCHVGERLKKLKRLA